MKLSEAFVGKINFSTEELAQLQHCQKHNKDQQFNEKIIAKLDSGGVWGVQLCSPKEALETVFQELSKMTAPNYFADLQKETEKRVGKTLLSQRIKTYVLDGNVEQIKPIIEAASKQKQICIKLLCADKTTAVTFFYKDHHELALDFVKNLTMDLNSNAPARNNPEDNQYR